MSRTNYSSGSKWEPIVGYSRVVRIHNQIEISGTVAADENNHLVGGDSMYEQAKYIFQKATRYLEMAGASKENVVRTRIYVTDISRWEEVGKAHGEYFRDINPATSMIEVSALIAKEYLVEIEFTAIV